MSNQEYTTERAAGGIEGLSLGAPLGGVSHSTPSTGGYTSTSTGGSSLTGGNHNASSHIDQHGDGHRTTAGTAAANAYKTGDYDARNSTSGDKGIGGGHGGPTAFESDASRVGTDGSNRDYSGNTGDRYAGDRSTGDRYAGDRSTGDRYAGDRSTGDRYTGDRTGDRHTRNQNDYQTGDYDARNSTSGDKGIGGGHGGPTAFESDASRVGTDRTGRDYEQHDHHHHHDSSSAGNIANSKSGVLAGMGAGHHDQSRTGPEFNNSTSSMTGSHGHHHGGAAATGAGIVGGAAILGDLGARDHTSGYEGIVADSITGQKHFATGSTSAGPPTTGTGYSGVGTGVGAGIGAGVGSGLTGDSQKKHSLTGNLSGKNHKEASGPIAELKQELKDHQKEGGYNTADKHPESKGPHGLVWHNGKYVHQRELDGHGSTGVPLK